MPFPWRRPDPPPPPPDRSGRCGGPCINDKHTRVKAAHCAVTGCGGNWRECPKHGWQAL